MDTFDFMKKLIKGNIDGSFLGHKINKQLRNKLSLIKIDH
jgi:hypothetical protein